MKQVADLRIEGIKNLNFGKDYDIEIVNNSIQIQADETYQILFPNGVEESILEVLMGEILDAIEMNDYETITLVIKQLKDFPDKDRRQFLGDTTDLYLDENLFVVYIDEAYQREIFVFPNVEVKVF